MCVRVRYVRAHVRAPCVCVRNPCDQCDAINIDIIHCALCDFSSRGVRRPDSGFYSSTPSASDRYTLLGAPTEQNDCRTPPQHRRQHRRTTTSTTTTTTSIHPPTMTASTTVRTLLLVGAALALCISAVHVSVVIVTPDTKTPTQKKPTSPFAPRKARPECHTSKRRVC